MSKATALGTFVLSVAAVATTSPPAAPAAPAPAVPATSTASGGPAAKGHGLDRYRHQPVDWTACRDAALTASGTRCARLTVPLDYGEPDGRTIEIAVSRIASTDPSRRRGILQTNPGGPGVRGLGMPGDLLKVMGPGLAAAYDVIGMDTRGLGESTPLDCGLRRGTWLHAPGADRAGFDESVRLSKEDARRCWDEHPEVLPHLSTRNVARDVDIVRSVLGEARTSWFGQSYGTVLGSTYAQMFPHRVDRLVLDSAPDPAEYPLRTVQRGGLANEEALDDFAAWAAPRDCEYGLGTTPAAVRAGVEELIRRAAEQPVRVGGYRITDHELPLLLLISVGDDNLNPEFAGMLRVLLDAADGKPVTVPPVLQGSLAVIFDSAGMPRAADYAAQLGVYCADAAMPHDPEYYWREVERSRASQPVFGPLTHAPLPCAFWEEEPHERLTVIDNPVPALQVQATGDTRTTYGSGLRMHRAMRGSRLVTVPVRAHTVYLSHPDDCVRRTVDAYLLDGALPARDIVCSSGT
ncbi:alpha/beta hydrolase [Kitasatospora sp. NPDC002965]|uniref:alpha/beta hydrolase n=1 Tax=Kitasatospora sp. NPDC002965 TaxID=3154775 RepID=UPI0033AAC843